MKRQVFMNLKSVLIAIIVGTLLFMTAYEWLKQYLFPGISIWQSHTLTIILCTVLATVATLIALSRQNIIKAKAVAVLNESEARFRKLFDENIDAILWFDAETGLIIDCNKSAEDLIGKSREDIIGVHQSTLYQLEIENEARFNKINTTKAFVPTRREIQIYHNSGKKIWTEVSITNIVINGKIIVQGTLHNIDDRKSTEEALRRSEEQYRSLIEQASDGIFITDGDAKIIEVNTAGLILLGYTREEILQLSFIDLVKVSPEKQLQIEKLRAGKTVLNELDMIRKDGTIVPVETRAKILKNGRIQGFMHDISGRKQTEELLKQSEKQFRTIVETSIDGFAIIDVAERFLYVNDSFCGILGYTQEEMLGMSLNDLRSKEQLENSILHPDKTLTTGINRFESRYRRKNGTFIDVDINAKSEEKGAGRFFLFIRDITERKAAEFELLRYQKNLEELVRKRTEELNSVSENLFASRNFLKIVIDTIPVRIFWKDRNCRYLGCNTSLAADSGLNDPEDIIGKSDYELAWREYADKYNDDDREIMNFGIPKIDFEEPQHSGGEEKWLRTSKVPLRDNHGVVIGVLGTYEDITEKKITQEQVRKSELRFQGIFDSSFQFTTLLSPTGEVVEVNNSALIFGKLERIDVINKPFWACGWWTGSPDTQSKLRDSISKAAQGEFIRYELSILNAFGNKTTVDLSFNPIRNDKGKVAFLIAEGRDISDLYNAKQSLMESEEKFRQIADNVNDGFFILDIATDQYLYTNKSFETIFRIKNGEAINRDELLASVIYPDDRSKLIKLNAHESRSAIEYRIRHENGQICWIREQTFTVKNADGIAYRIVGVLTDTTQYKNASEQSRLQQQQLLQADKMASLGILVSGVAHEINNPNNLVMFNIDVLKQVVEDIAPILDKHYFENPDQLIGGLPYIETKDQVNSLLKGISMGADRIRDIVANLKEFARVDTGSMKQEIHINKVVSAALLIVGNLIKKSTENFTVDYDPQIPAVTGNIQQIEQVIINLLTNACQALPDRTRAISVVTSFDAKTGHACVTITDEGVGISEENRKHLFDPFFTTKRDKGGTGLGLSVSYSIVQAHKGEFVIDSTEGKGTIVHLFLPVRAEEN